MNVLLATDGSASARNAERLLASSAWPSETRVAVMYVDQIVDGELALPADRYRKARLRAREEMRAHLERVRDALVAAGREVEVALSRGHPASVIVREARRRAADVIVVGSRGRGAIETAVLGSVAASVVDGAPCPVLVARAPTITRVILADDGSAGAKRAEDLVASAPHLAGLPVVIVSVFGFLPWYVVGDASTGVTVDARFYQELVDEERDEANRVAAEAADRLRARGVDVSTSVREGYAPQAIIDAAGEAKADLIVIGSRGNTGVRRLVLGSVARNVLFHAPGSVLIVRAKALADRNVAREGEAAAARRATATASPPPSS